METLAAAYVQTRIETASPAQLILILYDELIKNIMQASMYIREKQCESAHLRLVKAQMIVMELAGSVNKEAGLIATNLLSLYQFMYGELVDANIRKDEARLEPVLDMVSKLRDAWLNGVVYAAKK